MRACIVGGGLAGSLLAWRLAQATASWHIDLVLGESCRTDATAASGGAVRAYEPHPEQRRLATVSMVELLTSRTLRQWADYRQAGSVYLRRSADGLDAAVADIELMLPGSVRLAPVAELRRAGWTGLSAGATAVVEQRAGYTSPGRLRDAVLADGHFRRRVAVLPAAVDAITPRGNGTIACSAGDQSREYDVVVVAVGAWTAALLGSSGLPAIGYRTKSIQYAVHPTSGRCPPPFVDETTGLYGRPTTDGGLLLGLPTERWEVDPDRPPPTATDLHEAAVRLASDRFPQLRIGPANLKVGSADCYCDPPILSLRSVLDSDHQLFTFTGGSGGSVKTALAASQQAAAQLVESGQSTEFTPVVRRKGQP